MTATATETPAIDLAAIAGMSPLEQIAALKAATKQLQSGASEAMAADAKAKFEPLHAQMTEALAAVLDSENPERAALALKWIGESITEFRKLGRTYHKAVYGIAAPRKPREPKSDVEAVDTDVETAPAKGKGKAAA